VPRAARRLRKGVDLKALLYSVLAGVVIWLIPAPVGVSIKAWHLLAHFVATIVGIITSVRVAPPKRTDSGRVQVTLWGSRPG
jgi:hypothetical protein